jgi:hypothetical protein
LSLLSVSSVVIFRSGMTRRLLSMLLVVGPVITISASGGVPRVTGIKILYMKESDEKDEQPLPHPQRRSPQPNTLPSEARKIAYLFHLGNKTWSTKTPKLDEKMR